MGHELLPVDKMYEEYEPWLDGLTSHYHRQYHFILEREEIYNITCEGLLVAKRAFKDKPEKRAGLDPFKSYARRVIHNLVLKSLETHGPGKRNRTQGGAHYKTIPLDGVTLPARSSESEPDEPTIVRDLIQKAMVAGNPRAQRLFIDHFIKGQGMPEMALREGLSKQRIFQLIKPIRDRVKELSDDEG
jgi:RNA polymerase sigma factor (sigma-70 family)